MQYFLELLIFAGKTTLIVVAILLCISFLFQQIRRGRGTEVGMVRVLPLNPFFKELSRPIREAVLDAKTLKLERKAEKKQVKETSEKPRVYVLRFDGDLNASAGDQLAHEMDALLQVVRLNDEVVLLLESGGGRANAYGYAAAQLERLREKNISLTVCVDEVAASGGYMMACVANKLIASPFALLGSIGVIAMVPNLHRLLKKFNIDYNEFTSGKYKRTVSLLAENTPEGQAKLQEELETFHIMFKAFVQKYRPQIDMEKVGTGEVWYGAQAQELGLVDHLQTSHAYFLDRIQEADLYKIEFIAPTSIRDRISQWASIFSKNFA
ncbi:MAG: protease SohB [Acidobacteria bacterium]|nr:protease SohB [Acidobacteriota bacterium]